MEGKFQDYCLITGASGFVGRPFVRRMLETGKKVLIVGRSDTSLPAHQNLEFVQLDLHNREATRRFFETYNPSHLIHLAWEATPGKFWHSQENIRWVSSSAFLLDSFVSAGGKKAVLAGSCAEYEWTDNILDEETSTLSPKTLYSSSKNAFRQMAEVIAKDIDLVWARIFFPYGPEEDESKLISYIVKEVTQGSMPEFQIPSRAVDYILLEDVARILEALAYNDISGPVNICSGIARLPHQIAIDCAELFDQPGIFDLLNSQPMPNADIRVEGGLKKLSKVIDLKDLKPFSKGLLTYPRSSGN